MRKFVFSAIIGVTLIFGTGQVAFAQISGFFVEVGGFASGPHDEVILRSMVNDGRLTKGSLVWREGMPDWETAGTVAELAPLFAAVPPPLPTAPPPLPGAPQHAAPPPAWEQPAPHTVYTEPWGGHPAIAGWINMFFGIWSFTNDDFSGGLMTAGLQVGGIAVSIIGSSLWRSWFWSNPGLASIARITSFGGYVITVAGSIYGFYRGFTQYNRRMAAARGFAEAINSNPMNNISLVAFPTLDKRRFVGALAYSLSF